MSRYEIVYLLFIIALGSYVAVWMFVKWQDFILSMMFITGLISAKDIMFGLPWFLYCLRYVVQTFAVILMLVLIHMAYYIDDYAEQIRRERNA